MHIEIAIAIIRHPSQPRVLIQQRAQGVHLPGLWEFPGGKIEPGESPQECAMRESREETGLTVTITRALPVIEHTYPERTVRIHPFLCHAEDALSPVIADSIALWVAVEDLPRYQFPEANTGLVESIATGALDAK